MGAPAMSPNIGYPLGANIGSTFAMTVSPEVEAYFVAIALEHGTHPEPTFGITRNNLAQSIQQTMATHPGTAGALKTLQKEFTDRGGKLLAIDMNWMYQRLSDAYLDWLYSQPESKALEPQARANLAKSQAGTKYANAAYGLGLAPWKSW